jgi:uncharacterized protein (DUF736 family)
MIIGKFDKDGDGFYGKINTMTLDISCSIKPVKRNSDKAPTHRVFTKARSGMDIGAGWTNQSKHGNEYIAVKLDCPGLPAPISANLVESEDKFLLMWDRD